MTSLATYSGSMMAGDKVGGGAVAYVNGCAPNAL